MKKIKFERMDIGFIGAFISSFGIECIEKCIRGFSVKKGYTQCSIWLGSLLDGLFQVQTDGVKLIGYYRKTPSSKSIGFVKKSSDGCWVADKSYSTQARVEELLLEFRAKDEFDYKFLMAKFFISNIVPGTRLLIEEGLIQPTIVPKLLLDAVNRTSSSTSGTFADAEEAAASVIPEEDVIEYINKHYAHVTNCMTIAHAIRKHEHMEGDYQAIMSYCLKLAHNCLNDRRAATVVTTEETVVPAAEEEAAATVVVPEEESINSNIVDSSVYENVTDTDDEVSVTDEESALNKILDIVEEEEIKNLQDYKYDMFMYCSYGQIYIVQGGEEKCINTNFEEKELEELCVKKVQQLEKKGISILFLHRYNVCEDFKDSKYITCIRI